MSFRSSTLTAPPRPAVAAGSTRIALTVAGTALIALYVGMFVMRDVTAQRDFRTYLTAARAARMRLDPYRSQVLAAIAGKPVVPYVYPPVTLAVFMPLDSLDPSIAAAGWMGLKVLLLIGLIVLWRRSFLPNVGLLPLVLVTVFGWNFATLWDLRTGNVAMFECALLWGAFACFVRGHRTAFATLVVAGACFKLLPAVFLLLLLVPTEAAAPSPRRLLAAVAALVVVVVGPMLVGPAAHWQPFFLTIPDARTLGEANPGSFALASVLARIAGLAEPTASRWALAGWMAFAVALLASSAPFLVRTWSIGDARRWVMAAVFLYVVLGPRPMAYGFILLVPVVLYFAPRSPAGQALLALLISAQGLARAAYRAPTGVLYPYTPVLLATLVWLAIVVVDSRARATVDSIRWPSLKRGLASADISGGG